MTNDTISGLDDKSVESLACKGFIACLAYFTILRVWKRHSGDIKEKNFISQWMRTGREVPVIIFFVIQGM